MPWPKMTILVDRVKIVKANTLHVCEQCGATIKAGEFI